MFECVCLSVCVCERERACVCVRVSFRQTERERGNIISVGLVQQCPIGVPCEPDLLLGDCFISHISIFRWQRSDEKAKTMLST